MLVFVDIVAKRSYSGNIGHVPLRSGISSEAIGAGRRASPALEPDNLFN